MPNFATQFGLNWVDALVIAVFALYAVQGYAAGFVASFLDLVSFIVSFFLGLTLYSFAGHWIALTFGIAQGFANATGFFAVAFVSEIVVSILLRYLVYHVFFAPKKTVPFAPSRAHPLWHRFDHIFGIFPSIASAFILLSFLLTVVVALPLSPLLKNAVSHAYFGKQLLIATQDFEKRIQQVFGGAVSDTLNFLTIKPQSDEFVRLHFSTSAVSVDEPSENEMFSLINKERKAAGLLPLQQDDLLTVVARRHAIDMFAKGYFSHYTPKGLSPFDRMASADVSFVSAGENLALAPDVLLAIQGLMKSEGHRANILSAQFGRVGIGVIDGGIYGKMFVQEFTD